MKVNGIGARPKQDVQQGTPHHRQQPQAPQAQGLPPVPPEQQQPRRPQQHEGHHPEAIADEPLDALLEQVRDHGMDAEHPQGHQQG